MNSDDLNSQMRSEKNGMSKCYGREANVCQKLDIQFVKLYIEQETRVEQKISPLNLV